MGSRDWAFEGFKASKPPLLSGFWETLSLGSFFSHFSPWPRSQTHRTSNLVADKSFRLMFFGGGGMRVAWGGVQVYQLN